MTSLLGIISWCYNMWVKHFAGSRFTNTDVPAWLIKLVLLRLRFTLYAMVCSRSLDFAVACKSLHGRVAGAVMNTLHEKRAQIPDEGRTHFMRNT